jgi:hypothetical protein
LLGGVDYTFERAPLRNFPLILLLGLVCMLSSLGCGGSGTGPGSNAATKDFPPYQGKAVTLFDDLIDPNAVGLADVAAKPRTDPVLRARAQTAEAVARVRVATVSVDSVGGKPIYRLSLDIGTGSIVRRGFNDDRVEIAVRSDSPAFGVVKWLDTRLIGRTFVGFFHRYAAGGPTGLPSNADGAEDILLKFHLSADAPDVLTAVYEATALSEVSGK